MGARSIHFQLQGAHELLDNDIKMPISNSPVKQISIYAVQSFNADAA